MLDFKTKTRPCHIASVDRAKNPKFLAINHTLISFERDTYKGNKKVPTRLTIIRPLAAGWNSAPYKQNQKGVRTFKISEYANSDEHGPAIKLYAFEKVSNNMEKGPRCDDITAEIVTGNSFNFWLDEKRVDEIRKLQPNGLLKIDAFTLCEIQMTSRSKDTAIKGSGCKITEVKPVSFTLHSCIQVSVSIPLFELQLTSIHNSGFGAFSWHSG